MKVLMLGWEYPPHISGGLGTACEGLTRAMAYHGLDIDFVVPHLYGAERAPHMRLLDPSRVAGPVRAPVRRTETIEEIVPAAFSGAASEVTVEELLQKSELRSQILQHRPENLTSLGLEAASDSRINFLRIPSFLSPYLKPAVRRVKKKKKSVAEGAAEEDEWEEELIEEYSQTPVYRHLKHAEELLPPLVRSLLPHSLEEQGGGEHYSGDLFAEVGRYAARVLSLIKNYEQYQVIHAHDWMTFPAAVALKAVTGLPLVIHVHSLEFDRSGENGNRQIEEIEKIGLDAADSVIAVSYYTRSLINQRHGTSLDKIAVVHNGVYERKVVNSYKAEKNWPSKIVLFLGRVTFQKGPDYFVEAAARVIPHIPDVLFVMAGSGDMLPRMVERVNELGISSNFLFTGFLKGQEVEKMFSMADLYVMPSVSEPFGISPLEAISFNVPVIISRQSGVAEVLSHALKVNFWDIEQLANLIISVLKYPELSSDMNSMASEEVRRLRWEAAAARTIAIYGKTLARYAPH